MEPLRRPLPDQRPPAAVPSEVDAEASDTPAEVDALFRTQRRIAIGYFTKYGDGGTDMLPLGRLLKEEVRAIARELQVPAEIIDKPPSAGLWLGQTDEGAMGFTYAELERYLVEGPASVSPQLAERIQYLHRTSEHKRAVPPMPPV